MQTVRINKENIKALKTPTIKAESENPIGFFPPRFIIVDDSFDC